jgi:assimilatory nitrate reductase catalytic subunit
VLRALSPRELYLELSPVDAKALGVRPHDLVLVSSRRASVQARAFPTHTVQPGQVFLPMHDPAMNRLTFAAFDPHSRQPAYKACAVRVRRVEVIAGSSA